MGWGGDSARAGQSVSRAAQKETDQTREEKQEEKKADVRWSATIVYDKRWKAFVSVSSAVFTELNTGGTRRLRKYRMQEVSSLHVIVLFKTSYLVYPPVSLINLPTSL